MVKGDKSYLAKVSIIWRVFAIGKRSILAVYLIIFT
ncbi:hypothetical protein M640_04325 [Listeria monocytogenes]|nr:hypothetical protein M640_04325 [Listeria monocytogenes]ERH80053.1 hypothetical protein O167_14385 [Listeria monocytogenes serotype 4bV str. LS642]ERH81284.1 hypothetical protein O171_12125 [Listeria monocytogenes serotype 4bV str. LS645]ERH82718.1 hypothetical protein O174_12645 [Listeria monocytogenes serotype 4bV str. LS644]ERH87151.1 hypothetical protein N895_13865 [Listeria monocytogenes serotype 4bV str. LS542]ERH87950.1 hypothetical protein O168_11355 [Listeria monocytogenes serotype